MYVHILFVSMWTRPIFCRCTFSMALMCYFAFCERARGRGAIQMKMLCAVVVVIIESSNILFKTISLSDGLDVLKPYSRFFIIFSSIFPATIAIAMDFEKIEILSITSFDFVVAFGWGLAFPNEMASACHDCPSSLNVMLMRNSLTRPFLSLSPFCSPAHSNRSHVTHITVDYIRAQHFTCSNNFFSPCFRSHSNQTWNPVPCRDHVIYTAVCCARLRSLFPFSLSYFSPAAPKFNLSRVTLYVVENCKRCHRTWAESHKWCTY